jgi:hypothetical protein
MDKFTVARDSGLRPDAEIPILPYQSNLKDGEGEDTITASSGTKRCRGRPLKGKKAESPQEDHAAFGKDLSREAEAARRKFKDECPLTVVKISKAMKPPREDEVVHGRMQFRCSLRRSQ